MNPLPLAYAMTSDSQEDESESLFSRERTIERVRRLQFLKQSAVYLGCTLAARQLHVQIQRRGG